MKHFILEGEHLAPFAEFAHLEPQHHEFLKKGYDDGFFLFSGPQIPAHGGFLAARAESREELTELLAEEPFVKAGKMRFKQTVEYDPVQHQPILKDWFEGAKIAARTDRQTGSPAKGDEAISSAHFLLEGYHTVPFEERPAELIAAHRSFLQEGYNRGDFLLSGPTVPPKGGFLVARAEARKHLDALLEDEPYVKAKVMKFSRITQFDPLLYQPILGQWFKGAFVA